MWKYGNKKEIKDEDWDNPFMGNFPRHPIMSDLGFLLIDLFSDSSKPKITGQLESSTNFIPNRFNTSMTGKRTFCNSSKIVENKNRYSTFRESKERKTIIFFFI